MDDSSVMRKIVERSLRQAGVELEKVTEAGNGAEALASLHDNPVDLILCDINMPVDAGYGRAGICSPRWQNWKAPRVFRL